MKINSIRYIVISLIASFAVVGAVNAVGVFYYDAAANQFVLDGSLKISDPGSFKLLLRELNSTDDSHLYVNGRKDVQIRLDADNTDTSKFKVNNGVNTEVFSVDESGNTVVKGTTSLNGATTITGATTISGATTITGTTNITGTLSTTGNIVSPSISLMGVNNASLYLSWSTPVDMYYGGGIYWQGVNSKVSSALFGYTCVNTSTANNCASNSPTSGLSKGVWAWVAGVQAPAMTLTSDGNLTVTGKVIADGVTLGAAGTGTTTVGTLSCITEEGGLGEEDTAQSRSCTTAGYVLVGGSCSGSGSSVGTIVGQYDAGAQSYVCDPNSTTRAQTRVQCCKVQ